MFLNRCGRFFFSRISPFLFFVLLLSPILIAIIYLFFQNAQIRELEERFIRASRKEKLAFERKERKERFLKHYSASEPYFLDQQIESIFLSQKEANRLELLVNHPALSSKDLIQERLAFLKSPENRFSFAEEGILVSAQMKETQEKQRHPVQMDSEDLQKVLAIIEDIPIGQFMPAKQSPQLIIKEFHLKKQKSNLQTEFFEVEMDILKREFFKP